LQRFGYQLALGLSKKYQRRLILHMSTGEEADLLRQDKPSWVTAEVTPAFVAE